MSNWNSTLRVVVVTTFIIAQTMFAPAGYSILSEASVIEHVIGNTTEELDEVTFIDYETNSFAVFSGPSSLDVPIRIGRLELENGAPHLVPTREILRVKDLYVLRDLENENFLQVTERLPEGGFGRLLRYRGYDEASEWVDLEFVYQDRGDTVTILDHAKGKFFRTKFSKRRFNPYSLTPSSVERASTGELIALPGGSVKFLIKYTGTLDSVAQQGEWFHSRMDALNGQEIWMNRLVRGPPVEGAAL